MGHQVAEKHRISKGINEVPMYGQPRLNKACGPLLIKLEVFKSSTDGCVL